MTEFTPEWIEGQRKIIKDGTMTVKEIKLDEEIDTHVQMMKVRAKTEQCIRHYPLALDEIERLQSRVQELEAERFNKCSDCCYITPPFRYITKGR